MIRKYFLIPTLLLLVFLAWSPWLTKKFAENTARNLFESGQSGVVDGCGFGCDGCGATRFRKVPFGYLVTIKYKCGMKNYFQEEDRFVGILGASFTIIRK